MSGGGGTTTVKQSNMQYDPTLQALQTARLGLAQNIMGGDIPSVMSGYLNKVLIPSTTNSMTAAGLGRSGAVGEAVSNAVFSQGSGMLTQLLTGVPSAAQGFGKSQQSKDPGFFDYFSSIMGAI